jgi:hypothetical protein
LAQQIRTAQSRLTKLLLAEPRVNFAPTCRRPNGLKNRLSVSGIWRQQFAQSESEQAAAGA